MIAVVLVAEVGAYLFGNPERDAPLRRQIAKRERLVRQERRLWCCGKDHGRPSDILHLTEAQQKIRALANGKTRSQIPGVNIADVVGKIAGKLLRQCTGWDLRKVVDGTQRIQMDLA